MKKRKKIQSEKVIAVPLGVHRWIKTEAARQGKTMGDVVADLVRKRRRGK